MPHAIWSGSISFGLVNVPVKLVSAVAKKDIHFHQLHDADGVRVQLKRVCPADGKEVPYENIVKGYEVSRGNYVVIKPEELEALDPKAHRTIDIEEFVDLTQIDPIYFEHPYYLLPDKGAEKAYALLRVAMRNTGKAAIGQVVIRGKQYLVALRPGQNAISMVTLLYADEIISEAALEGLPAADARPDERELSMAEQLVSSQAADFDLSRYKDEFLERVMNLIERKAEGQEIVAQPAAPAAAGKVVDLMSALEASLAAAKGKIKRKGPKRAGKSA